MNREDFKKIETQDEFVALLKKHDLFREDDVTFDDIEEDGMYTFTGNGFQLDAALLDSLEISALLVEGDVTVESLSVNDILPDFGVFCVSGHVHCKDFYCATESTGVSIGGNLSVSHIFYADCGNSVVQVNGDLTAKVLFVSQCLVEVRGDEKSEFDQSVSNSDLAALGLTTEEGEKAEKAIAAYFEALSP
ncbi:MAG: hypothetical protein AAGF12_12195 [Myxococcota bacterium]